ncbi:hypothetical protein BH09BAC5_BH09BAC5_03950 [soil metagenome]
MRFIVVLFLFLISFSLDAKKAPKWRKGDFKKSESGLQYKILKQGRGDSIGETDWVGFDLLFYNSDGKPQNSLKIHRNEGSLVDMDDPKIVSGMKEAIGLMKKGGKAFFIIPPLLNSGKDTLYCFIHIKKIGHSLSSDLNIPQNKNPDDSVSIIIEDPNQKYFGDSLFSVMKLVEVPQQAGCGSVSVNVAFKFEMSWFDKGTQHKNILVFIECPEQYGKDFFVSGSTYVITAVPMTENLKQGHNTMNAYSLEKLEMYYGLRIKKM